MNGKKRFVGKLWLVLVLAMVMAFMPGDVLGQGATGPVDAGIVILYDGMVFSQPNAHARPRTVRDSQTQFEAFYINGVYSPVQSVTWSILGNHCSNTMISDDGLLFLSRTETVGIHIIISAISTADTSIYATATVLVKSGFIRCEDLCLCIFVDSCATMHIPVNVCINNENLFLPMNALFPYTCHIGNQHPTVGLWIYRLGTLLEPEPASHRFIGWGGRSRYNERIISPEELFVLPIGVILGTNPIVNIIALWEPIRNQPCPNTNLARDTQGAVMTASSEASNRPAHRSNNGIREGAATQSWSALGINQEWLMVDFGQIRNFNHIRIFQGGNRVADYRFEYSVDGVTWTSFRSGTRIMQATPAYYEFTHPTTIQARYVRLVSERSNGVLPIVVFEFEVYYLPS